MSKKECFVTVRKIIFQKDDFAILSVEDTETREVFSIKGSVSNNLSYKNKYKLIGEERNDKYGKHYLIIYFSEEYDFSTKEDVDTFLKTILSSSQFEKINSVDNILEILENKNTEELSKIKGLGNKSIEKLIDKFHSLKDNSKAYVELGNLGISKNIIDKLIIEYKGVDLLLQKIRDNPYELMEVEGFGWVKCDDLGNKLGIKGKDERRVSAFVIFFLETNANNGSTIISPMEFVEQVTNNFPDLSFDELIVILNKLKLKNKLYWESDFICLKKYYDMEMSIKDNLKRLQSAKSSLEYFDFDKIIETVENKQGWKYTDEQKEALKECMDNNVMIIYAKAGCGKTSIVNGFLQTVKDLYVAQCSLSGRAASRLNEVNGMESFTIHRLLGHNGQEFTVNCLEQNVIIVDEVSMIDIYLFNELIKRIASGSKLILMGDIGQLESIGTGNVLKDMIDSNIIKSKELTKVHRQSAKSGILMESYKVYESKKIVLDTFEGVKIFGELQDLKLDIFDNKHFTLIKTLENLKELYNKVQDINKIQILTPMNYKGSACVDSINRAVQNIYNPLNNDKKEISYIYDKKTFTLREQDKIMIRENKYGLETISGNAIDVFNGNLGRIMKINEKEGNMIVSINGINDIIIERNNFKIVVLGYCIGVYKSQGSQFENVILTLDMDASILLTKELIYTGLTRAMKYCILVAQNKALAYATMRSKVSKKKTLLKKFLIEN